MKKIGFGSGRYNGFGGKVETGETVEQAAIRELYEESKLKTNNVQKVGEINFKFPHKPEWNRVVHFFQTKDWEGAPSETEEMAPEWFGINNIPYDKMWSSDSHWLPPVLQGKYVTGTIVFTENQTVKEKNLEITPMS